MPDFTADVTLSPGPSFALGIQAGLLFARAEREDAGET